MVLSSTKQDAQKDLGTLIFSSIRILMLVGVAPVVLMFFFGNVTTENLQTFAFYFRITAVGLILMAIYKAAQLFSFGKVGDQTPALKSFGGLLHDPEAGLIGQFFPDVAKLFFGNKLRLVLVMILFIGGAIFISENPIQTSQSFIGQSAVPDIPFEVRQAGKVGLKTVPSAPAENIFVIAVALLPTMFVNWLLRNKNRILRILVVMGTLIAAITIFGLLLHNFRYGASDIATLAVLKFWFIIGVITAVTGSILPGEILHLFNNFITGSSTLLSSDLFITFLLIILVITGMTLVITEIRYFTRPTGASG